MGVIKGGLFVFVCFLLFFSFLIANSLLTLTMSLDYDVVAPELSSGIVSAIEENSNIDEIFDDQIESMQDYCLNNSDYVFSDEGYTFDVSCDVVSQGKEAIVKNAVDNLVEDSYYKEYDCGFFECWNSGNPSFLVSEKTRSYMSGKFFFFLFVSIVLLLLMFFLIENKKNFFIVAGSLIMASSLPFAKLEWLLGFFDKFTFGLLSVFFSQSSSVFFIIFGFGLVVLLFGIALKFFGFGMKLSKFFSKKGENKNSSDETSANKSEKTSKSNNSNKK